MPSYAEPVDEDLSNVGDVLDISTLGDFTVRTLNGRNGTSIVLGANRLTTSSPDTGLYAGVISGTGGLTKDGTGSLTLVGANTYTGDTVVNAGALFIGAGGTTGSIAGNLVNNATVYFNRSNDITYGGAISGTGTVYKYGSGTLTLTGTNTSTGNTSIYAGTLAIGAGGALSTSSQLSLYGTGRFDISGAGSNQSIGTLSGVAGTQVLLGGNTLTVNLTAINVFAGTISGTGGLIKNGTGTLYLTGDNTYSGDTVVNAGNLYIGNGGTAGSIAGNLVNNAYVYFTRGNDSTYGGVISGTGAVNKQGAGTLTLSGANTYTGITNITAGTLAIGAGGSLYDSSSISLYGTGRFDISGAGSDQSIGTLSGLTGTQVLLGGNTLTVNQTIGYSFAGVISGTGSLIKNGAHILHLTGDNTYSGDTVLNAGAIYIGYGGTTGSIAGNLVNNGAVYFYRSNDITYGGVISGTGTVYKYGAGTLTLTGANNYTSSTNIHAGTLAIGAGGTLSDSTSLWLSGTGRFDISGADSDQSIGNLSGVAGTQVLLGGNSLTVRQNVSSIFAGTISGTGGLIKNGTGNLTLTGGNTYTGNTYVGAGGLIFNGSQNSTLGNITVASGSLLGFTVSQPVNFTGRVDLQTNSVLSIFANSGSSALSADTMTIGAGTRFNLYGISNASALPLTLFTTTGGITGDFADVSVGGFSGTVDYLTLSTRKSDDGRSYLADYGLSWTARNNLAHGTFTLTDAGNSFTLGGALGDQSANAATGWNGTSLTKNGAGALILTGDSTYSGGTTIAGGTLKLGHQTSTGSVLGNIVNNGTLWIDRTGAHTFANTVSGSGGLVYSGGGTLALTGTNTYAGGTLVTAGTVSISNDANLGATSGTVTLDGGTLQVNGTAMGNLSRSITIGASGGGLGVADSGHTLIVSTNISGGDLTKRGEGKLVLTGTNAYRNTIIAQGTLAGELSSIRGDIDVAAGARLDLNHSGHNTFGRLLNGAGSFNLYGTGTTLLTSDSAGFTGHSFLHAGTLLVGHDATARLGGSLDVASGATLGGSGTIGSGAGSVVTIGAGATLSPGNSIGTLTINGDLKFEDGSRFVVEVNPLGADSDRLNVSGAAILNGGTVAHIGATGNYNTRSTYTILDAGSLSGTFGAVTSDFAFLNPKLVYDYAAGTVQLELLRNDRDFAALARTRNQIAIANAIESIGYNAGHGVYDAVVQLADDADAIRNSYDQLSGELHGAVRSVQILDSRFVRDAANDRLRSAFGQAASGEAPAMAYASDGAQVMVDATHEGPVFWAQSHGAWGTFDTDAATFSMDRQIGGAMLGGDVSVGQWRVGVLGGYSRTEVRAKSQQAISDNTTLGAYAGSRWGKAGVRLGLTQTWHDIETDRFVIMPGLSGRLEADYGGSTRQIFVEGDYELMARQDSRIEAYANLAQVRSQTDAFGETGVAAALDGDKSAHEVLFATLGLRAAHEVTLGQSAGRLRASAGWRHASGDTAVEGTHAFSAGEAFTLNGMPITDSAAVVDAGMDVRFNARTAFSLNYVGQFSTGARDHGFNARMSFSF